MSTANTTRKATSMEFVDELPPVNRRGRNSIFRGTAVALLEHPGKWAVVRKDINKSPTAHAAKARLNKILAETGDNFETTVRKDGDHFVVYARALVPGKA